MDDGECYAPFCASVGSLICAWQLSCSWGQKDKLWLCMDGKATKKRRVKEIHYIYLCKHFLKWFLQFHVPNPLNRRIYLGWLYLWFMENLYLHSQTEALDWCWLVCSDSSDCSFLRGKTSCIVFNGYLSIKLALAARQSRENTQHQLVWTASLTLKG